jgi:Fur family zinc uptake transcriptional regulator
MSTIGFEQHNHSHCIQDGLKAVEDACSRRGLQFTPVRKRVMELLLDGHRAMGAYEILDVLREEGHGAQPPVAYRALDFLVSHGFAHRIERLNAFAACMHPDEDHTAAFLICRACDAVAEAHADPAKGLLGGAARHTGFEVETAVIEAVGLCPNCQAGEAR